MGLKIVELVLPILNDAKYQDSVDYYALSLSCTT